MRGMERDVRVIKNGGSTINRLEVTTASCFVFTREGNNGIVHGVFFATFTTTTETKNKYKMLPNDGIKSVC